MKADEIKRILDADPQAEFAFRPDWRSMAVVKVRGLRPAGRQRGCWTYSESTHVIEGHWIPCADESLTVLSRELVTVAEAQAVIDAHENAATASAERRRHAERLVQRLDDLGVPASANLASVEVEDLLALGALLDRLEGA